MAWCGNGGYYGILTAVKASDFDPNRAVILGIMSPKGLNVSTDAQKLTIFDPVAVWGGTEEEISLTEECNAHQEQSTSAGPGIDPGHSIIIPGSETVN